ncbi:AzlC family ABC transporter permease [Limosilactobacillus ingluviei]|uniref:AzlC family ABC transporter permease n=1 Tax=Limosilactobacillus ingluviei TaxID=148604 RepID=UPI0024BB9510|nr:AzlC family ABC transporter permease [Limosilactobacillus ingluviei]
MPRSAFNVAWHASLPVLFGYLILGLGYGLYMHNLGFAWWYPPLMAATIYGGSVEFVIATMLTQHFTPLTVLLITFVVDFRQFFYAVSMLNRYDSGDWRQWLRIYGLSDETFAVNYTLHVPTGINRQTVYTWVTVLDYGYWISGALFGGCLGQALALQIPGLEFVMTALFIVLCLDQWQRESDHLSTLSGLVLTALTLWLVGKTYFLLVTLLLLVLEYSWLDWRRRQS